MRFSIALLSLLLMDCNIDHVAKLEKENNELHKKLAEAHRADLNTQEKCATAAQRFKAREYPPDRDTLNMNQTNHYNVKLGQCFVFIEWNYKDSASQTGSWFKRMVLSDVFENTTYAEFSQHTEVIRGQDPKVRVLTCQIPTLATCSSIGDFIDGTQGYMSN